MPEADQPQQSQKIHISPEELKRLKLAKKEAKKKQSAKQPIAQEPPPKVLERHFVAVPDQPSLTNKMGDLRVMTFNLLAQGLIKRQLFPHSGTVLRWKTRRQLVIDEINLYSPDILTMQEMDNYEQYYKQVFDDLGYETMYYKHETKVHGCCIAYKKGKFTFIDYETIDYSTDITCPPSYYSGNIGQLLALQLNSNPKVCFAVGNTHLYWKPSANYERFRQGIIFSNRLLQFKSKLLENEKWSSNKWVMLLLGDFNTTPDEAVYPLLIDNELKQYHIDDLEDSLSVTISKHKAEANDEETTAISIDDLISIEELSKKYIQCKWQSVYSNFGKINQNREEQDFCGEPKFTNYTVAFKGTLDYMFLEQDAEVSIKSLLMMPKEEYLKPSLPNKNFGSDHLCLIADVEF